MPRVRLPSRPDFCEQRSPGGGFAKPGDSWNRFPFWAAQLKAFSLWWGYSNQGTYYVREFFNTASMNDTTYFLITNIIDRFFWKGKLLGAENLPKSGPAVFVANHVGPKGPIGAVCSIHLRFYPWIIADMVDKRLASDYLRIDFVESSLRLRPPLSQWTAKAISLISVPMLTSLGCVPVHRGEYDDIQNTLQDSLALLKEGKIVLVFPEEPNLELDPQTKMRPFLKGFTRLGELFFEGTGGILCFYPVAIHETKKVTVGKPIPFNPDHPYELERHRLKDLLEKEIRGMYLEMDMGDAS